MENKKMSYWDLSSVDEKKKGMIDALMFERAAVSHVKNCEAAASFFIFSSRPILMRCR